MLPWRGPLFLTSPGGKRHREAAAAPYSLYSSTSDTPSSYTTPPPQRESTAKPYAETRFQVLALPSPNPRRRITHRRPQQQEQEAASQGGRHESGAGQDSPFIPARACWRERRNYAACLCQYRFGRYVPWWWMRGRARGRVGGREGRSAASGMNDAPTHFSLPYLFH